MSCGTPEIPTIKYKEIKEDDRDLLRRKIENTEEQSSFKQNKWNL
jgi:hypothetical protein